MLLSRGWPGDKRTGPAHKYRWRADVPVCTNYRFPFLGDKFLNLLAQHFRKVHPGKKIELAELRDGIRKIGFKPALMRDVVRSMSVEGTELDR